MRRSSASRNGWVPSNDYGTIDTPGEQGQGFEEVRRGRKIDS